jgi:hypothetical protein
MRNNNNLTYKINWNIIKIDFKFKIKEYKNKHISRIF